VGPTMPLTTLETGVSIPRTLLKWQTQTYLYVSPRLVVITE